MKRILITLFICASIFIASRALADSYDAEWIAECIHDNKDEHQSVEVITRYCTCMNDKMSSSETRSITEWEKTHPQEMAECDKVAGWK